MKNTSLKFKINLGLLITGFITVFSGIFLQVKFHIHHKVGLDANGPGIGPGYYEWSAMHKIFVVVFSLFIIRHIYLHWKWYKAVIIKRLFAKNRQVLTLTIIFFFVASTGFIPWIIDLIGGDETFRKAFIEIHDKIAILLAIYLIKHVIKRFKWFLSMFGRIRKSLAQAV